MASDLDYVQYVIDQIKTNGTITYKKMFGEYLIYLNNKPVVMVCDNTAFVKMLDCIKHLMENAETGFPYKGAKEHYRGPLKTSVFGGLLTLWRKPLHANSLYYKELRFSPWYL